MPHKEMRKNKPAASAVWKKKHAASSGQRPLARVAATAWVGLSTPPRMSSNLDNQVFTVVQTLGQQTFAQTAITASYGAVYFTVASIDQITSFTSLFDQYRIDWIEATFRPAFTANPLGVASSIYIPSLFTAVDFDDAVTPTSIAQLEDYANCTTSTYETVVRRWKPHAAIAAYAGAFTSYGNVESPWIDASSTAVQHYGLKTAITSGATGQTALQSWVATYRIMCSWRNVR